MSRRTTTLFPRWATCLLLCASMGAGLSACDDDSEPVPVAPATFQLGINPVGEVALDGFAPLSDGDVLSVELGFQGAHMVVLAFQAAEHIAAGETFHLRLELSVADNLKEKFTLKQRKTVDGGDGYVYYLNIFFITADYLDYADEPVTIQAELLDLDYETKVTTSVDVTIRPPT